MDDDKNKEPETAGQPKKRVLTWIIGGCAVMAAVVGLIYVMTTPPTPAEAAEQYIEDHYDAVAEAVTHAAFPDSPLKAEIIAEVAESIAEQVIPYSCRQTASTNATVDTRCNLSFSLNRPLELRVDAPFQVSLSNTGRDIFGRTTPVVQDSEPIISEMTVNGFNLEKFKEVQAAAEKAKETISEVGAEIEEVKDSISEVGSEVEEAKETISEAGSEIKDLFGK